MGVVVTRRVDASATFDKMLDQLDDRLHDVRALCHAKAATIRVFDWVGRDEIILHVNHEQCVIGIDRADTFWRTGAEELEILAKEGRLRRSKATRRQLYQLAIPPHRRMLLLRCCCDLSSAAEARVGNVRLRSGTPHRSRLDALKSRKHRAALFLVRPDCLWANSFCRLFNFAFLPKP